MKKTGVLLINLGSTEKPTPGSVRRFLREFLSDPRVIDIPGILRFLVLHIVILPLRPAKTAHAYAKIWTDRGSPISVHGQDFADAVQAGLDSLHPGKFQTALAMRYGKPAIREGICTLLRQRLHKIVAFPMYPQYAASSTASTLAEVYFHASTAWDVPAVIVVPAFHANPGYLKSLAGTITETLAKEGDVDQVLFSFHGLPEGQIKKSDGSGGCLLTAACCEHPGNRLGFCYRAQCFATAREAAELAGIAAGSWSVSFQSRLGRDPWIRPYTDEVLAQAPKKGISRIAVVCPSFVADCLETLEEMDIRGRETFVAAGGSKFVFVPSLNNRPDWVSAAASMIAQAAGT